MSKDLNEIVDERVQAKVKDTLGSQLYNGIVLAEQREVLQETLQEAQELIKSLQDEVVEARKPKLTAEGPGPWGMGWNSDGTPVAAP